MADPRVNGRKQQKQRAEDGAAQADVVDVVEAVGGCVVVGIRDTNLEHGTKVHTIRLLLVHPRHDEQLGAPQIK